MSYILFTIDNLVGTASTIEHNDFLRSPCMLSMCRHFVTQCSFHDRWLFGHIECFAVVEHSSRGGAVQLCANSCSTRSCIEPIMKNLTFTSHAYPTSHPTLNMFKPQVDLCAKRCMQNKRRFLWDALSGTLLWDTLVGHSCGTLLWETLVGHPCGTLFMGTPSYGTLLWDTLSGTLLWVWDTLVIHSCRTLVWDTLVGHSCPTLLGHSCRKLLRGTLLGHS